MKSFALAATVAAGLLCTTGTADAQFRSRGYSYQNYSYPTYSYPTYSYPSYSYANPNYSNGSIVTTNYTPFTTGTVITSGGGYYPPTTSGFYSPGYPSTYGSSYYPSTYGSYYSPSTYNGTYASPYTGGWRGRGWRR